MVRPHSHDPSQSTDQALEASEEGKRAVLVSLAVLGVTALIQAAVVVLSGSVALLADTVHNLSDALTAVPLWVAFTLARAPAVAALHRTASAASRTSPVSSSSS